MTLYATTAIQTRFLSYRKGFNRQSMTKTITSPASIIASPSPKIMADSYISFIIGMGALLLVFLLHPRIGIRDVDAYAYIVGAYSIQAGHGYTDLLGQPLNHWPPGYSILISFFSHTILVSQIINYLSLGITAAMIFLLARRNRWRQLPAIALAIALTCNFLLRDVTNAKPDALTYLGFLAGIWLWLQGRYVGSYLILVALIPFKLIAATFAPAAILASMWKKYHSGESQNFWPEVVGSIGWVVVMAAIVLFNLKTIHVTFPASHAAPSVGTLVAAAKEFTFSIPRTFLSNWYGSLINPWVLGGFGIVLVTGLICLYSLRQFNVNYGIIAILILLFCGLLQLFKSYGGSVRLTGYGLVLLILAFRPKVGSENKWAAYAVLSVALCVANTLVANGDGANHVCYETLAYNLKNAGLPNASISTNSFHILDVHVRTPTTPVSDLKEVKDDYYLLITLPNYDAIATTIQPISSLPDDWREIATFEGASLLQRTRPRASVNMKTEAVKIR